MDPIVRCSARLRRFYQHKSYVVPKLGLSAMTVRSFGNRSQPLSLRGLIEDNVATFTSPHMPLTDGPVTCSNLCVSFGREGIYIMSAKVKCNSEKPVAFLVGSCTNQPEGRWCVIFGALNFQSESWATSKSSVGAFWTYGKSGWVTEEYATAATQGVTFRLLVTRDMQRSPRKFLAEWLQKFDVKSMRHLDRFDNEPPSYAIPDFDPADSLSAEVDEDGVLKLKGAIIFE